MARGSVIARPQSGPDAWEVMVSMPRDPLTGKRRRLTQTVRGTKADAERALTALLHRADTQTMAATSGTVAHLLERWFEVGQTAWSVTTIADYRRRIDQHIVPAIGARRLDKLDLATIDHFYRSLSAKGLSPGSVRRVHAVLRRALRQGVRWGWLASNPAAEATLPRAVRPDIRPPSPGELQAVLARIDAHAPDFGALVRFGAMAGLRRGELVALRWRDVDLARGRLHVRRNIVQVGGSRWEKEPKSHQQRKLSLDPVMVAILSAHRERVEDAARSAGVTLAPDAFVWARSPDGAVALVPDSITQTWRRWARSAGCTARLHDLRHFMATELLGAGVDVRTVSARLGHAQTSTTLDIYAHAIEARDQDAAAIIGSLVGGGRFLS